MERVRQTYTIPEIAKILGVGRNQAYEAAKSGQLPTVRIGKRILIPIAAFDRMLELAVPSAQAAVDR